GQQPGRERIRGGAGGGTGGGVPRGRVPARGRAGSHGPDLQPSRRALRTAAGRGIRRAPLEPRHRVRPGGGATTRAPDGRSRLAVSRARTRGTLPLLGSPRGKR